MIHHTAITISRVAVSITFFCTASMVMNCIVPRDTGYIVPIYTATPRTINLSDRITYTSLFHYTFLSRSGEYVIKYYILLKLSSKIFLHLALVFRPVVFIGIWN